MALVNYVNRAACSSTSTGVGDLVLMADTGFVIPVMTGSELQYVVYNDAGDWEIGSAPVYGATLHRSLISAPFDSSNGGAFVNFSAGTKHVVFALNADTLVFCGRDSTMTGTWHPPVASDGGLAGGDQAASTGGGVAFCARAYADTGGVAIGKGTLASGGVSIGRATTALVAGGVAIGDNVVTNGTAVALGKDATGTDSVSIGNATVADAAGSVAIGKKAKVSGSAALNSVALGSALVTFPNFCSYASKPPPVASGDVQALATEQTLTGHTAVSGVTNVSFDSPPACVFNIDIVGQSADTNWNVVGIDIVGMRGPVGIVGTPVTTVRGRSAGFASTVTATLTFASSLLKVTLTGSTSVAMDWAIVVRYSAVERVL